MRKKTFRPPHVFESWLFLGDGGSTLKVEIVGWKGKATVRAYVPKNDRIHYLRLTGGDTSKYEKNKFEVKREDTQPPEQPDGIKNNI